MKFGFFLLAGVMCLSGGGGAQVVTSVWVGGSVGWNTAGNWDPSGVPSADNNTRVEFNAGSGGIVDQDTGNSVTLNQLVFGAEAGSFTIGGNGLVFQATPSPDFFDPRMQVSSFNPQVVSNDLELLNEVTIAGGEQTDVTLSGIVSGSGAVKVELPSGGRVRYREGIKNYVGSTRIVNGRIDLETEQRVLGNLFIEASGSSYAVLPGGTLELRSKVLGSDGLLSLTGGMIVVRSGGGIGELNADAPNFHWDAGAYFSTNSHEHHAETIWRGGTWTGAVGTIVQIFLPWTLEGPGNKSLQRWVQTASNAAAITWAEGDVFANTHGILQLDAAADLLITGNDAWSGGAVLVGAAAALVKDGGFGETLLDGFLENDGQVEVRTGTLRVSGDGSGSHAGVFTAEGSGVQMLFDGGAHNLTDGGSLVADNGGEIRAVAGAALTFSAGTRLSASDAAINFQDSSLDGSGTVLAVLTNGSLRFTSSELGGMAADVLDVGGPSGTVFLANNGFSGNSLDRSLRTGSGISLRFTTTDVAVASAVGIHADGPLSFEGAVLLVSTGAAALTTGGSLPVFVRDGANRIDPALHLTNRPLDIASASLVLGGGGSFTTPISVTNGAFTLESGEFLANLDVSLPPIALDDGVLRIESNAAFRLTRTFGSNSHGISDAPAGGGTFRLAGGTFDHGPVVFTVAPRFIWSGGVLAGETLFICQSNLFVTGPDLHTISNSFVQYEAQATVDGGMLVMDGSAALAAGNGFTPLVVSNGAVIAGSTTNGILMLHANVFDGSVGALTVAVPMVLSGMVHVEGEATLAADSTFRPAGLDAHAGIFELADGASLRFSGGEQRFLDGSGWSHVPSFSGATGTPRVIIDGADVRSAAIIGNFAVDLDFASGSFGGFLTNNPDINGLNGITLTWTGGDFVGGSNVMFALTQVNTVDNTNVIQIAGENEKGLVGRMVVFNSRAQWDGPGTVSMTSVGDRRSIWQFQQGLSVSSNAVIAGLPTQRVELVNGGELVLHTGATLQVQAELSMFGRPIELAEDSMLILQGGGLLQANAVHSLSNGLISFEGGRYQIGDLQVSAGNVTDDTFRVQALLQYQNGLAMADANNGDFNLRFVSGTMSASGLVRFATARFAWQNGSFRSVNVFDTNEYPVFVWGDGKGLGASAVLSGTNKEVLYSRLVLPTAEWTSGNIILQGEAARTASVFFAGGLVSDGSMAVQSVFSNHAQMVFIDGDWQHGGGIMDVQAELDMLSESSLMIETGAVLRLAGGARLLGISAAMIDGTLAVESPVTYTHINGDPLLVSTNGRLSGTGVFDGTVVVDGTLAPGASAGILTVSNITLGADSVYEWELANWAQGPGVGFDQLAVSGLAVISNGLTIRITVTNYIGDFTGEDRTFEILSSTNGILLSSVTNVFISQSGAQSASGGRWELIHTNNSLFLAYSLDPYLLWAASNGLAGAQALFTADPDADEWHNGIEFVFGTSPTNAASGGGGLNIKLFQNGISDYALFTYHVTKQSSYLNPRLLLQTEVGGANQTAFSGVEGVTVVPQFDVPTPAFIQTQVYVPATTPMRFGHVEVSR